MIAALVEGKLARATNGARGNCPECKGEVYARTPEHAIRHFAHIPLPDGEERFCSRDPGEMSEWHRRWQWERTDLGCIEVTQGQHRADVVNASGVVIEFQRSTITPEDVKARESHWRRGVWVLDGTPNDRGEPRVLIRRLPDQADDDVYRRFKWSHANLVLYRAKWPVWIDVGERCLQVRHASDGQGAGWIVPREWFVREIINGNRMTLRPHVAREAPARNTRKRVGHARSEAAEDLAKLPVGCDRPRPVEPCCGSRPPGVLGEPIVLACQLCPSSPTYWRATAKREE